MFDFRLIPPDRITNGEFDSSKYQFELLLINSLISGLSII